MNGETLIDTPLETGGSYNSIDWGAVIAEAPSVEQEQQSFESFNLPWDFWGISNDGSQETQLVETALGKSNLDLSQILAKAPAVSSFSSSDNVFGKTSGGGILGFLGNAAKAIGKFLGSSVGGGTMETSPANQYTKTMPATGTSQAAAAIKKNWLGIAALAVVLLVGAVLIFRRKS